MTSPLSAEARTLAELNVGLAHQLTWSFVRRHAPRAPVDDLAGEALFGLVYAASKFLPNLGIPFGAYAAMVIRQRLIHFVNGWRKHDHAKASDVAEDPDRPFDPPAAADVDLGELLDARELCLRLVGQLPPRTARAVWLVMAEGLTFREAAFRLGVSKQRVQQIVSRATDRARERFADWT